MEKNVKIFKKQVDLFLFLWYNLQGSAKNTKNFKKYEKSIVKLQKLRYTYIVTYFDGLVAQLVRAHA